MTSAQLVTWIKRNPLPFGCGLAAVALGVATFFRGDAVPEATTLLEQKSAEAHRYSANLANASQLKEQYDAVTAANRAIEARLIRASELGINQQYFYKLESEYGVKLTDMRQNPRAPAPAGAAKGAFLPIGFAVTVQGKFPAVLDFLQAVEHGAHYCRILSATCSGDRTDTVTLVLNLELLGQP